MEDGSIWPLAAVAGGVASAFLLFQLMFIRRQVARIVLLNNCVEERDILRAQIGGLMTQLGRAYAESEALRAELERVRDEINEIREGHGASELRRRLADMRASVQETIDSNEAPEKLPYMIVADAFTDAELRMLCKFTLKIDYDGLTGENLHEKAASLISWYERRRDIDKLVAALSSERPNVNWEKLLGSL